MRQFESLQRYALERLRRFGTLLDALGRFGTLGDALGTPWDVDLLGFRMPQNSLARETNFEHKLVKKCLLFSF